MRHEPPPSGKRVASGLNGFADPLNALPHRRCSWHKSRTPGGCHSVHEPLVNRSAVFQAHEHSFRRVGSEARDHEASRVLRSVIGIYAQLPIPIEEAFKGMNGTTTVYFTHAFVKSRTEMYALPATDWIIDPMGGGKYCSVTVTASDETD